MAGNNDLTFRIGIDNSDFDKGLKETQKKLTAAMAQFEREKSLIKIRADIDIAGLDETADKAKILDIQAKALTDTLDIQRQKLQAAANAYELVAESQGEQAAASKKNELAMEKERLKVVQLEKDLEKLKQSATGIDTTVKVNVDDSEIDNIKIDAPKVDIKAEVDTSQVEKSVSKAETSIKASVDKLSRQQALIQLRGQVQLEGLDEAAGSTEKLKLQEEALTAQVELQKEKIALLSRAYEELVRRQGENSDAAQIAAINLEKEQLAMARLQQQTQDLSKQTEIALGVEWELLGLVEPAIQGINALIAAGHTIPIPHAHAAAVAAVALSAIVVGSKEATDELRENNPAQILSDSFEDLDFGEVETDISDSFAEISDSATQTSQEIETAFEESAENVSEEMENLSGSYADYLDDALSIIQILTAETENLGDSLGVVNSQLPYMKTETGRIAAIALGVYKTFAEMTKAVIDFSQTAVDGFKEVRKQASELYLSLSKAQEISNLIDLAGGDYDDVRDYVRGVQDAVIKGAADDPEVLAMEKYGVVIQDTKGKLLEFDAALENLYQGYLKAKEAGEAEAYIIMTNGQSIHDVAGFLENYGKAKERAAQIKWSTSDFDSLNELTTNLKMAEVQTNEFNNALSTLGVPLANLAAESNFEFFKKATELIEENRDTILLWEFAAIEAFKSGKEAVIEFADSAIKELKELNEFFGVTDKLKSLIVGIGESVGLTAEFEETLTASDSDKDSIFDRAKKDLDAYNAANEKSREETKESRSEAEGLSYSLNRIAKYKEEIADIKIELQFGGDDYKKSLAQLEQWRETALRDARRYEEEQKVIAEEYALKRELIELEHQKELEKIREESLDRAKGFLQEAADIEYESTHSAFEKQLYDIEQWKTAQLEKATTAEESAAIVTAALAKESAAIKAEAEDIQNNISSLTNEAANIEFKNLHSAFEQQLRDIEQWKQAQLEKARTAEEVSATIANAAMKEADAFEREVDRIRGKIESAQDRLARLTLSQRDNDIYQAQKQYYQDLQDLPKEFADAIYNAEIAAIKKREKEDEGGSYTKRPNAAPQDDTYYQLLDFTKNNKQIETNTDRLIKLDAEQEAYNEVLKNARLGIEDIGRSVDRAKIPLMGLTGELSKTESAAEQTIQQLQGTADTSKDFAGVLGNANSAISENANALKNATSATDTFEKALEKNAQIRAQNAEKSLQLPHLQQSESEGKIKVMFGDDPIYGKNRIQNGVKILYGDDMSEPVNLDKADEIPAIYSKFANLGDATEKLTADINSANVDSLEDVNEAAENTAQDLAANVTSLESFNDAAEKVVQNLAQVGNIDLQKSLTDLQTAINPSTEKLTAFETELKSVTDSLQQAADKINGIGFKGFKAPETPTKAQSTEGDTVDKGLDAIQTTGDLVVLGADIAALLGSLTPQTAAAVAIGGGILKALADITQQVRNASDSDDTPAAKTPLPNTPIDNSTTNQYSDKITQELQAINQQLSQGLTDILEEEKNIAQGVKDLKNLPAPNELPKFNPADLRPTSTPDLTSADIADLMNRKILTPINTPVLSEQNSSIPQLNFDSFNSELNNAQLVISEFTLSLKDSADKINDLSLNALQNDILADITQIFSNGVFNQMTQELSTLSQTAGNIAQNVSALQKQRQQPPQITVSPNISIDLGGAYVFDNSMKQKLTDDITSEVANAITDAVSTATSKTSYGYGN